MPVKQLVRHCWPHCTRLGLHVRQLVDEAALHVEHVTSHGEHLLLEESAKVPEGHELAATHCAPFRKVPAAHEVHCVAVLVQAPQVESHGRQMPSLRYSPAWHPGTQVVLVVESRMKPVAQAVHCELCGPKHWVHCELHGLHTPSSEYSPALQLATHVPVRSRLFPEAQDVHADPLTQVAQLAAHTVHLPALANWPAGHVRAQVVPSAECT